MTDKKTLVQQLQLLKKNQLDINMLLTNELSMRMLDQFTVSRLKKSKLLIKDNIFELESKLYPDIIA